LCSKLVYIILIVKKRCASFAADFFTQSLLAMNRSFSGMTGVNRHGLAFVDHRR